MAKEARVMLFGEPESLHARLTWSRKEPRAFAWGALCISVGDRKIWADEHGRGIIWSWIDLLDHLARTWVFLEHEQSWPSGIRPGDPRRLYDASWLENVLKPQGVSSSDPSIYKFMRRHDIASGLQGAYLPPIMLVREGLEMWIATEFDDGYRWARRAPAKAVLRVLEALGDSIAERVAAEDDGRAIAAVARWAKRRETPLDKLAAVQLGITVARFGDTWANEPRVVALPVRRDPFHESEIMAAARMVGDVEVDVRNQVVRAVHGVPVGNYSLLDAASFRAVEHIRHLQGAPHEEGASAAQWLRHYRSLEADDPVDPEELLKSFGVHISSADFHTGSFDAIATWGPDHGPAVIVNESGQHSQGYRGRRTTIAHELAHLLLDRGSSLPVAEVLGSAAPSAVEKRANAFAAELLLPKQVAATRLRDATDKRTTLEEMVEQFDVSTIVVGWQVKNGDGWAMLDADSKRLVGRWTAQWEKGFR